MALNNEFYKEIFDNEIKWSNKINKNLFNITYCKLELKPFYIEKKEKLEYEQSLTDNEFLKPFINSINKIIDKINYFEELSLKNKNPDLKELIPLFLSNQMNNNIQENDNINFNLIKLQARRELLEDKKEQLINSKITEEDDYLYDDFDYEIKTK